MCLQYCFRLRPVGQVPKLAPTIYFLIFICIPHILFLYLYSTHIVLVFVFYKNVFVFLFHKYCYYICFQQVLFFVFVFHKYCFCICIPQILFLYLYSTINFFVFVFHTYCFCFCIPHILFSVTMHLCPCRLPIFIKKSLLSA